MQSTSPVTFAFTGLTLAFSHKFAGTGVYLLSEEKNQQWRVRWRRSLYCLFWIAFLYVSTSVGPADLCYSNGPLQKTIAEQLTFYDSSRISRKIKRDTQYHW